MKNWLLKICGPILVCLFAISSATSAELTKSDAVKLLENMGKKNIVVAAVVQGFGRIPMSPISLSSPNVAYVIGYAERKNGNREEVERPFFYDKDIGWFDYEVDPTNRRVRLWTVQGYKELSPEDSLKK